MPCTDGGPSYDDRRLVEENTMLKAALCGVLSVLEARNENGLNLINYDEAGISRPYLRQWWENHKAEDIARIEREQAEAEREARRNAALSKLTDAELRILGLRRK